MSEKLDTLEDAKKMCAKVINDLKAGKVDGNDAAKLFSGIKTFVDTEVARLKNDPDVEANLEYARKVAAKAAKEIDLTKAREILLSRNFRALEDHAGIVDAEVQLVEGEKQAKEVMKLVAEGEKQVKKR